MQLIKITILNFLILYGLLLMASIIAFPIHVWFENNVLQSHAEYALHHSYFYLLHYIGYGAIWVACFYIIARVWTTIQWGFEYAKRSIKKQPLQDFGNPLLALPKDSLQPEGKFKTLKVALFLFIIFWIGFSFDAESRYLRYMDNPMYRKAVIGNVTMYAFPFLIFLILYTKVFYHTIKRPSVLP
jgi:hypothetical protein